MGSEMNKAAALLPVVRAGDGRTLSRWVRLKAALPLVWQHDSLRSALRDTKSESEPSDRIGLNWIERNIEGLRCGHKVICFQTLERFHPNFVPLEAILCVNTTFNRHVYPKTTYRIDMLRVSVSFYTLNLHSTLQSKTVALSRSFM